MNAFTRAGATTAFLAASVLLTASPSNAMRPDTTGSETEAEDSAEYLRPLAGAPRSPDVYQAWIDSGRARDLAAFVAECLRPLEGGKRSPDVYQGWIDGCRARGSE